MLKRIAAIYEAMTQTVVAAWAPLLVAMVVVVGITRR